MYIYVSTCVGAVTRGVVVCRCSGQFVGESRIKTGVRSDVSNTDRNRILLGRIEDSKCVLSGSLRGLQNLKEQRRRVVRYLALVHAGLRRRRERRLYAAPPVVSQGHAQR
jgi:hypothetical protein